MTHHPRRVRPPLALLVSLSVLAFLAPSAYAGTYTQILCANPDTRQGLVANGSLPSATDFTESGAPALSRSYRCQRGTTMGGDDGLFAEAQGGWTTGTVNGGGGFRYRAPSDTTFAGATLYRQSVLSGRFGAVVNGSGAMAMYGQPVFDGCGWGGGCSSQGTTADPFDAANRVSFGSSPSGGFDYALLCDIPGGWSCTADGAYIRLYGGKVTLQDTTPPGVTAVSGELATSSRVSGTAGLNFTATDAGAGVYRVRALLDGVQVDERLAAANPASCADANSANSDPYEFAAAKPCAASSAGSYSYDTTTWPEGVHTLTIQAVDAAGNASNAISRSIAVDNTEPPGAPQDVQVLGGESWRSGNLFTVTWTNPSWPLPIVKANWRMCPNGNPFALTCTDGGQTGPDITRLSGLSVPSTGDWTLWVTLEDESGPTTIERTGDPVHLRYDSAAPGAAQLDRGNGWLNADQAHTVVRKIHPPVLRPASGISGYSYTVNGGDPDGTVDLAGAEPTLVLEGTALREGRNVLRTRAISGSGVPSTEVAAAEIDLDRQAPQVSPDGAPPQNVHQPGAVTFELSAVDQPGLSGVTAAPRDRAVSEGGHVEYRIDRGPWQHARGDRVSVTVPGATGQHTVEYRAHDVAGNASRQLSQTVLIDATPPVTARIGDHTGWVGADQAAGHARTLGLEGDQPPASGVRGWSVTTDGTDPDATIDVAGDRGTAWRPAAALPEGVHTLKARAVSNAGHAGAAGSAVIRIDRTSPQTGLTGAPSQTDWLDGAVSFGLYGEDALAGMSGGYVEHRIDGGAWKRVAAAAGSIDVAAATGQHVVEYRAGDAAGNVSPIRSRTVRIDATDPAPPRMAAPARWLTGEHADAYRAHVSLDGASPASGLAGWSVTTDGQRPDATVDQTGGELTLGSLAEGANTVKVRAISGVGRAGETASIVVNVDRSAPGVDLTGEAGEWRTGPVSLAAVGTDQDQLSGMVAAPTAQPITEGAYVEWRLDDGAWQRARGGHASITVDVEGEHTVSARAVDAAGNPSSVISTPVRISNAAPGRARIDAPAGWLNASRADGFEAPVTLATGEALPSAGLAGFSTTHDGSDPDASVDGSGERIRFGSLPEGEVTLKARAISGARVASPDVGQAVVRVDRTAPRTVIAGAPAEGSWARDAVTLELTGIDQPALSGMERGRVETRVGEGEWTRTDGPKGVVRLAEDGRHTVAARAVDAAGNVGAERTISVLVDTAAPTGAAFEVAADGAAVSVGLDDTTSGLAGAVIEVQQAGAGGAGRSAPASRWRGLPTQLDDGVATADVAATGLPAGRYDVRVRATDRAGNELTWGGADGVAGTPLDLTVNQPAQPQVIERERTVERTVERVVAGSSAPRVPIVGGVAPAARVNERVCRTVTVGRRRTRTALGTMIVAAAPQVRLNDPLVAGVATRRQLRRVEFRVAGRRVLVDRSAPYRVRVQPSHLLGKANAKLTARIVPQSGRARTASTTLRASACDAVFSVEARSSSAGRSLVMRLDARQTVRALTVVLPPGVRPAGAAPLTLRVVAVDGTTRAFRITRRGRRLIAAKGAPKIRLVGRQVRIADLPARTGGAELRVPLPRVQMRRLLPRATLRARAVLGGRTRTLRAVLRP